MDNTKEQLNGNLDEPKGLGTLANRWRDLARTLDAAGLSDKAAGVRFCANELDRWLDMEMPKLVDQAVRETIQEQCKGFEAI